MNENVPVVSPASSPVAPPLPRQGFIRLSPINRRRFDTFKANRRGYWSFWIFLVLFILSLFAEFIANDRPIIASYKGELLYPVLVDYPEEKFGGFLAVTDYRDPFIAKEIEENGWAVWPPIRYSYNTRRLDPPVPAPSAPHMVAHRRAMQARGRGPRRNRVPGHRVELARHRRQQPRRDRAGHLRLSHLCPVRPDARRHLVHRGHPGRSRAGLLRRLGRPFCSSASSRSGPRSRRSTCSSSSSAIITPSFFVLLGILLLFSWVSLVGVVRAEFLRARNFEYVRAARALGLSNATIMFKHLLPNAMVATLTFMPFIINGSITTLTSLDFLGFGLPPGSPSLGELLAQGKSNLQAPWLGLTGFFVIALMLSLLIFIGEAVRDAFDPRKTFR